MTPSDPRAAAIEQALREVRIPATNLYGPYDRRLDRDEIDAIVSALLALPVAETERPFPIQDDPAIPSIPWKVIAPCEDRAKWNHGGQSLETLANRDGLCTTEAIAVLTDVAWTKVVVRGDEATAMLAKIVQERLSALPVAETGWQLAVKRIATWRDSVLKARNESAYLVNSRDFAALNGEYRAYEAVLSLFPPPPTTSWLPLWKEARYAPSDHSMLLLYSPTNQRGRIDWGFRDLTTGKFMVSSALEQWTPIEEYGGVVTHFIKVRDIPAPPEPPEGEK